MILQSIIDIIESVAPRGTQEEWDNSGLQVGDTSAAIRTALLTTDVTEAVVNEAIEMGCELIISHHPLLFHGLKHVCGQTPQERCVAACIRHGIAVYSAHTSMDKYLHGVSGRMAGQIGLKEYQILSAEGLGVIGKLNNPMPLEAFLAHVKKAFDAPVLRYVNGPKREIQTVALCGGAGAEFVEEAIAQGADAFITADVRYHTFLDANGRICLIDMDHWVSEHFTRDIFKKLLDGKVATVISQADQSPINNLIIT